MAVAVTLCPFPSQGQCEVELSLAEYTAARTVILESKSLIKDLNKIIVEYYITATFEWRFQQPTPVAFVANHASCLVTLMCRVNDMHGDYPLVTTGTRAARGTPSELHSGYWPLAEWTSEAEILTLFKRFHYCQTACGHELHTHIRCILRWLECRGFAVSRVSCRENEENLLRSESLAKFCETNSKMRLC